MVVLPELKLVDHCIHSSRAIWLFTLGMFCNVTFWRESASQDRVANEITENVVKRVVWYSCLFIIHNVIVDCRIIFSCFRIIVSNDRLPIDKGKTRFYGVEHNSMIYRRIFERGKSSPSSQVPTLTIRSARLRLRPREILHDNRIACAPTSYNAAPRAFETFRDLFCESIRRSARTGA